MNVHNDDNTYTKHVYKRENGNIFFHFSFFVVQKVQKVQLYMSTTIE